MKKVLAFDLGASSGRGILATYDNGKITLEEIHRFENDGVMVRGTLYWDVIYLFNQIKQGIVNARLKGGFDSIGIDTWGVDFGLVDENGDLVTNPVHYRDARTDGIPEEVFEEISKQNVYDRTGIQIMNFNTLFQMYYMAKYKKKTLSLADKMLFMPDLLNYFLTGEKKAEYTLASTSQMIDPYTRNWDTELISKLGIPTEALCDIVMPGNIIGKLSPEICEELSVDAADVVAVTSHDTASAIVSVPSEEKDFVYISCGTWSLFGTELDDPIICEEGLKASYTNEGGFGGKIRFLTNIMGLWLIQECRRSWKKQGTELSFPELVRLSEEADAFKCFVDPDYEEFAKPGNMPQKVQKYCEMTGQYVPQTIGEIARCIYESLALKYRYAFDNLKKLTGKDYKSIHILGGGANAANLCQMTANACGVSVWAGPTEATAIGNIAVQLIASGEIKDIADARKVIKYSFDVKEYLPGDCDNWNEAYNTFKSIVENN